MKLPKPVCLVLLLWSLAAVAFAGEPFRTDINPALLCYQAFALTPSLSQDDHQYMFDREWRGRALDPRFDRLIAGYDNQFKLLRQASQARVPCDWGVDLTQGPDTLLPGLARAKAVAQTARLRAMWHLRRGRPNEARDDLLAAFWLGRNVGNDGVVIGALVSFAMETILTSAVAENSFEFSPETLRELIAGFDATRDRVTVQQCMAVEQFSFFEWFITKLRELQMETPGDDAAVLAKVRALFARIFVEEAKPDPEFVERVIRFAGGTSAGLIARFQELKPLYVELTALLGLPYGQYEAASREFQEKLAKHSNPLSANFLSAIPKSRAKEFLVQTRLAMVHAAVEYRLHGDGGFRKVADPCGDGPFRFERLTVGGVDRGFLLRSKLNTHGFDEVLVFATNVAPLVEVQGRNAGQPLAKEPKGK